MNNLKISVADINNPWRTHIADYLAREFPPANSDNKATVLEAVAAALIASNKVRFGPSPSPENLVSIRQVIASAVADGRPLPLLMPWGSKKPDNGTVDVAELGGLKSIIALQERVQRVYSPGIHLVMRVEDLSGDYLFREDGSVAMLGSTHYVVAFAKLMRLFGLPFVEVKHEYSLMDGATYIAEADRLRPLFFDYMTETEIYGIQDDPSLASYRALEHEGWTGVIPMEQREFYRSRYARAAPGMSLQAQNQKLAGYFASILARIRLRGYGMEERGKDFINLSFAPPVPGTPRSFAERRVYYRTLPETLARTHIPPWRARGFLKIDGDSVGMKLATFEEPLELVPAIVTLSRNDESVDVRADHLVVG